jgi:hypothetical protein
MASRQGRVAVWTAVLGGTLACVWPVQTGRAQAPPADAASTASATPLVGVWTLNRDLSDSPTEGVPPAGGGSRGDSGGRRRGGGGVGGGFGGGRRGGGGAPGAPPAVDPEEQARIQNALHDILNPPERLTIVQTESMVIITGPDGRTTRLAPDGKKIKDDSTRIERRTKWDGGKLVTEITGLPAGKLTETWAVDSERRQLHITLKKDDDHRPLMVTRVYDGAPK